MIIKTTNPFSKFPYDFQKDFLKEIAKIIASGKSIQIAGAPGAGGSLLLNILDKIPNIKEKYFGTDNKYLFILFDGDSLLELSSVSAARLFLFKLDPESVNAADSEMLTRLEEKINRICNEKRLVLMIDHLNKLNLEVLQRFFANLYTLFRNNEENFSFIFAVDKPLNNDHDLKNYGLLFRCITENILKVPQLNRSDSLWFIDKKEKLLGITLQDADKIKIFDLTGGFPRTLRRVVEALGKGIKLAEIEANPEIESNLRDHLAELSGYKSLIGEIPILNTFITNKNRVSNSERIEGISLINKLTRNEEIVLKILIKSRGEIIKRDDAIARVWGENDLGISDHAYDQIIHRLKKKLKESIPIVTIETIRGRGHLLKVEKGDY